MSGATTSGAGAELRHRLEREVLVCDGAMGTMLGAAGVSYDRCFPELSISRPDLVGAIHRAYLSAGADIIETNTFGANRIAMERHGFGDQVKAINTASVELAQAVREEIEVDALIAGSIGPVVVARRSWSVTEAEAVEALVEQTVALEEAGADIIFFETFGDLSALVQTVRVVTEVCALPVVAQVTFLEDGRTIAGDSPAAVAEALEDLGVVALGANCTLGPRGLLSAVKQLARVTSVPLIVQPNAGPPAIVGGRVQYQRNQEYFARTALRLVELGVSVVGGCCGTTPRHIEAIAQSVRGLQPGRRNADARPQRLDAGEQRSTADEKSRFRTKLLSGQFVVACELRLPEGSDPEAAIAEVSLVRESGADAVVIAEAASSRVHISPVTFGILVQERVGMDAILTATTLGKSMLGLQADLLGAHAFGLQSVLCRTKTPLPEGDYPKLTGVYDVTSVELVEMLQSLNEARDHTGARIRRAMSFLVGSCVDPSAVDLEESAARARAEIAAGVDFLVTEPVFDLGGLERFREALGAIQVPLLLGVTALRDFEHAEYLRYEVPGARVPDELLRRLERADGPHEGRQIATELVWGASGIVQGVVVMPATGTAQEGAALLDAILDLGQSWNLPPVFPGPERTIEN